MQLDVMGLFWLASSAYARLEFQREPFQHHFDDLVWFLVPLLRIFKVTFAENAHNSWRSFGSFCASFFFSIFSVRACERSEAERGRCVVEAAPQARPEDHFGGIICSSFVAGHHLGLTSALSALQHCQNNCAFRFLAAQVFIDLAMIWGFILSFVAPRLEIHFCRACFQATLLVDF